MPVIRYRKPRTPYEKALRWVRIILGFSVLALGALLLVLPGPGIPFVIGGMAILATEYAWARRYLKRFKEEGEKLGSIFFGKKKPPQEQTSRQDKKNEAQK